MDDLTTRLLAAIEETERDAKDMPYDRHGPWWAESRPKAPRWGESSTVSIESAGGTIAEMAEEAALAADHIARRDPASVLRRCAADRKIVARHKAEVLGKSTRNPKPVICSYCSHVPDVVDWPCPDLFDLAEGYGITEETNRG